MISSVEESSVHSPIIPFSPFVEQHSWGKQGTASLAARLLFQNSGTTLNRRECYSGICIGTHASMPTHIAYDNSVTLLELIRNEVIEVDASKVEHYERLHQSGLPFLFKIVSVASPQSIHVHPDTPDSIRLHEKYPDIYPDSMGKAEMAVALSAVDALFGFRSAADIVTELARVPEFADAVGRLTTDNFVKVVKNGRAGPKDLRVLFESFMDCPAEKLTSCLHGAVNRFSKMPDGSLSSDDTLLLTLHAQYPEDATCFCVYFFNHIKLEPGSAVFIHPKEPHSYLNGDLVEISTCSTNVVRAGLTSSPSDKEEFVNLLTYDDSPVEISTGNRKDDCTTVFVPPVDEFVLYKYEIPPGGDHELNVTMAPSIIVCVSGEGYISELEKDTAKMLPLCSGVIYYLKADTKFLVTSFASVEGIPSANLLAVRVSVNESATPGSSCVIS